MLPAPAGRPVRRRRCLGRLMALAAFVGAFAALAPHPRRAFSKSARAGSQLSSDKELQLADFLKAFNDALAQVAPLQEQVAEGKLVPNYGERAQEILTRACSSAGGSAAADLERALDGALEMLFLRQAALLRKQVAARSETGRQTIDTVAKVEQQFMAARSETGRQTIDTVAKVEQQFMAAGQELVRPGSSWSLEADREALRAAMEAGLRHRAALVEERARSAKTQQATIDVISSLQTQLERLAQKVQGARGGSPWVLSTSYRVPKTPLQVVGRYEQGRASVELNLTPDKDPVNSKAGFVEGLGPANIGVSFNLGV